MAFLDQFKGYLQRHQDELMKASCHAVTVAELPQAYEARGGKPADRQEPSNTVASAVKRLVEQDRHRSLIGAIDRMNSKRQANGKPVVYVPA